MRETKQKETTMNQQCNEKDKELDNDQQAENYGLSDEDFEDFLKKEFTKQPLHADYPHLFLNLAPRAISNWRKRYRGHARVWKRLFQKDRVIKEFVEAAPVIDAVLKLVANSDSPEKFTVIDLCSGRGYISMFLSELLSPERVEKFVLVDKQWPVHGLAPKPHHISWTHIYGSIKEHHHIPDDYPNFFQSWPIPLTTSKQDLKSGTERRKMTKLFFTEKGPIIIVAIHLCGTLSLRAVELFNNNPEVTFLCLKPCCLPEMVHAKRHEVFKLGGHEFDAKDVCMAGRWKKNVWYGPPRTHLKSYFERWS